MMKFFLIFILTVSFFYKGNSQFIVLPQEQARADYFHTLIPQTDNNSFKFLAIRDNNYTTAGRERHQILTYDFNGNFIDSVNIKKGYVPISVPLRDNNYYYWSCIYLDTTVFQANTMDVFILKFDSVFNCVLTSRVSRLINSEQYWPSNIIRIKNHFYVSVKSNTNNVLQVYKLNNLLVKVDSVKFSDATVVEIRKSFDDKLVIAGYGFPPLNIWGGSYQAKIIMDTNLVILNSFTLDSLSYLTAGGSILTGCSSKIGISPSSLKVVPITSTKNLIMGHYPIIYNSNCDNEEGIVHSIINNNNQILNTQIISNSNRSTTYLDNVNYADFKNSNIYTVGTEGYTYQVGSGFLQAQNTSILVCKLDTMANTIWKKTFGDDMFYRPVSIIQTLDSGLLVSGIRYNAAQTSYPGVGQSFILRLDKNGDVISVGIKEYSSSNFSPFKCYPNPSKDIIYIDVPFELRYEVYVYDVVGKQVFENKFYDNTTAISTSNLNSGVYFVKIKTKGNWQTCKFIKE